MKKKLILNVSMVGDDCLRTIEEALLAELHKLRLDGKDDLHVDLEEELRKLEDRLNG